MAVMRKSLWLVVCFLLLIGCSAARIGYNNADWFVSQYADRYLDLDRSQRAWLRARLREHIEWHRQHELPRYHALLIQTQANYLNGLDEEEVARLADEAQARYVALAERLLPDLADLLVRLDARQINHLERRLQQDLDRQRESSATDDGHARLIQRIETWTGRLSAEQRAQIRTVLETRPALDPDAEMLRRSARTAAFLVALRAGDGYGEIHGMLQAWWVEPAQARRVGPADEAVARFLAVDAVFTQRQRQRVVARLDGYRRDVQALAGRELFAGLAP